MPDHRKTLSKAESKATEKKLRHMYAKEGKPRSEAERKQRIAIAISYARKGKVGSKGGLKK